MKYARINLTGQVVESRYIFPPLPLIEQGGDFALDQLYVLKEKLIRRRQTQKILITLQTDFRAYPGQLEEIWRYLQDLRQAGKELYFYAKSYDLKALYLGSACQHRLIPDYGTVSHLGLARESFHLKFLLERLGIEAEIYRRGQYKGAADIFRTSSMDEPQQEAYRLLLQRTAAVLEDAVVAHTPASAEDIRELKNGLMLTADQAVARGLATRSAYSSDLIKSWKKEKLKPDRIRIGKLSVGKGKCIAVLSFDGNIMDGKNKKTTLLGPTCGDISYVDMINRLAGKSSVTAVIFKVNSGGGSASASAEIAHALENLREKKPLVVVQSGVAGSGGYYISFPGEKIFTQQSTITGSIGVVYLLFQVSAFFNRHGVTRSVLKENTLADLGSAWRRRQEHDRALIMQQVDQIYDTFTSQVARFRPLSQAEVDQLGQGRIWSGLDAVENKLCDAVGGLQQAIDYLKKEHHLTAKRLDFYPKRKKNLLGSLLGAGRSQGLALAEAADYLSGFADDGQRLLCYTEALLTSRLRI